MLSIALLIIKFMVEIECGFLYKYSVNISLNK